MLKRLWPLEIDPDDPSVPHVTVPCARCPMHFFVARDHPALPNGPFFCPDHSDALLQQKQPDYSEAYLICDRCGAQLTAHATTREAATVQLDAEIVVKRWRKASGDNREDLCASCLS